MVNKYIPKQKDIVLVNLSPIKGHEQNGYRPAVVISGNNFNEFTKMSILLPITSNEKEFPTHYKLGNTKKVHGSVLCEHVRSIDYEARSLKFVEKLNDEDFLGVYTLYLACIED